MRPSTRDCARPASCTTLARRRRLHHTGDAGPLRFLHRHGRLGTHHQWPRRRAKRRLGRRDPRTERGSERRAELRADFIVYATGYQRLAQAGAILSSEIIQQTRTHRRHRLRLPTRRWAMGWSDRERMEADTAAGPLVPQRQFWADAILLAHTGIADQGPPCRSANANLRPTLISRRLRRKPPTATASILPDRRRNFLSIRKHIHAEVVGTVRDWAAEVPWPYHRGANRAGPPHFRIGSSPAVPARQRRGRSTSRSGLPELDRADLKLRNLLAG